MYVLVCKEVRYEKPSVEEMKLVNELGVSATHLDTDYCKNKIEHYDFFPEKVVIAETVDGVEYEVKVEKY